MTEQGTAESEATRMARALAHPLRSRILARLNEGAASPNQMAVELGASIGTVAYHVRVLNGLGCIELVDTAQRRGATEHFYRATRRAVLSSEAWTALPPAVRGRFAAQWFERSSEDIAAALRSGDFEARENTHFSFAPVLLDERAWNELSAALDGVLELATRLEAESAARREPGQEPIRARVVLAEYQAGPAPGDDASGQGG